MVDSFRILTLMNLKYRINELHQNANPNIVIALVGNKVDLEENRKVLTQVSIIFFYLHNVIIIGG